MSKFCSDINCEFYEDYPNGTKPKFKLCPFCGALLIYEKPLPPEEQPSAIGPSVESDTDLLIVNNHAIDLPMSPAIKPSGIQTDNVIVTFYTAIQLSHFTKTCSAISLRFYYSPLVELNLDLLEFKHYNVGQYEAITYALLSNSVSIPSQLLQNTGGAKTLIIPYRYYLDGQKEKYYSNKGFSYRCLILSQLNFFSPNVVSQYDMLILPPDLTPGELNYYKDYKKLLEILFCLYSPKLDLSKEGRLLPFNTIKVELSTVLHSLCYSHVMCKTRKYLLSKKEYICSHLYNKDEIIDIMRELLLGWIIALAQTYLPFHLKFYLTFLSLDDKLMQQCAGEIYDILFRDISSDFILSIIQEETKINLFLEYRTEIVASPNLLHYAMQIVSGLDTVSLILFLPLYHILFNSKQAFEQAHINHSFLDNAYWGLPAGVQFKHNPNIELSKILNVMSEFNTSPILPYCITLLYLRLDILSELLAILAIPFLPFFSVLLYRIDNWSLIREDTELRESVYNKFLTQSVDTPNLMNQEHICQVSDVIFQMVLLIMGRQDIPNISFKEACLLLQVLARLLLIYDGNNDIFSELKFNSTQTHIFNLLPSSTLIKSIQQCVAEHRLNRPPRCNNVCVDEVIVWNTLYCIKFPSSYAWVDSVSREFCKRLDSHSLQCLLNSTVNLCTTKTGISQYVFRDISLRLIHLADKSQTPLEDHKLIVQSLLEVPENKYSVIIDVLAKIVVLHKPDIMGTNPVEHILSVPWYPLLVRHCSSQLLIRSGYPEADVLLTLCMETIRKLDSDFRKLTISVSHLEVVIKYKFTYLLLLKSLPLVSKTLTKVINETTFNSDLSILESILNYFLQQHKLIGDLKKLLDSTNSGIYSTEISIFLEIEYKSAPISTICLYSNEKGYVLIPGNNKFSSFNMLQIKDMLRTLPNFLKSQFYKSQFKLEVASYLKSTNDRLTITVDTIYIDLWIPALQIVSLEISSLFNMTILLSSVEQHFSIYRNSPENVKDEIYNLLPVLKQFGEIYNEAKLEESLEKVICFFRLKTVEKLVKHILQVKDKYNFTGQFSAIESISNLQLNIGDNQLSIITTELLSTAAILSGLTELHLEILQTLVACVELFTWTSGVLDNTADLDNFTELALNSVDSTCKHVNRITSFKHVCTIFMPFILQIEAVDEYCFLSKLKLVHDNLDNSSKFHPLLTMSRDCAKESELEFWKELKQAHTSVGGKTISQLNQIMQSGKFVLSTGPNTRSINDILKLHVCYNSSTQTDLVHSLEFLKEMGSNIILITPLMHEDKHSAKFVSILDEVIVLADLFLKMQHSGNMFFRELTHEYTCQSIDRVKQDIIFLRDECKKCTAQLVQARDTLYLLNYFTASQILAIQIGLEGMDNGNDLDRDTFHLLTLIREELSQQDIEHAYSRFKHGSSSYQSPTSSVASSADSTASYSSRSRSGTVFSDSEDSLLIKSPLLQVSISDIRCEVEDNLLENVYKNNKNTLYPLERISKFLDYLHSPLSDKPIQFPSSFIEKEPNLVSVARSAILTSVLSLYLESGCRFSFPSHHEVLICSEHTTAEDVDIFWRRALSSPSNSEIFCLAFIENLRYEIAVQSVTSLKKYRQLKDEGISFQLVLLCSLESEQSSYMATALAQYKRIYTPITDTGRIKEFVFQIISNINKSPKDSPYLPLEPASAVDPDRCCVRVVSSQVAGSGKSLTVLRLAEKLSRIARLPLSANMCTTVSLFESQGCESKTATKLIGSPSYDSPYGRICHLDITTTCYEELIPFLFKLLMTGVICDEYGRIFRCSKRNYYIIEVTLSSQSPEHELLKFLSLFPDWQCLDPNSTLEYLKLHSEPPIRTQITLFDQKEMESHDYQRVYAYVNKLKSKQKHQIIDNYSYKPVDQCDKPIEILSELLKSCSINNPSWNVLKHFISFLNTQLVACESNIYCNLISVDKNWKGFKTFLVDCMILMSRDFTTPSLINCLEGPSVDIVQGHCVAQKRKWEEKNHPYIFLNEDRQTMSFFGIYVTEQLSHLDSFDQMRVIEKKVFPRELYRTLKLNKADMEQDCSTWDRNKMISILSNVMDNSLTPLTDVDPNYVLTIDNLKKMLAIHMRFRCNIPVIMMGETGCGKTRLINFMCKLQAKTRDIVNLVVLKVHGDTTKHDILASYEKALELAYSNTKHEVDTILFFDEANTSPMIGLIKEILCDRRIDGTHIPTDIRLQFIAACNPYRKHTPEMIAKLASAGLGIVTGDRIVREQFGDIPLRDLVYRVIPLPQSLLSLVWDFGKLSYETENSYIVEIITIHLKVYLRAAAARVLSAVQEYMRGRRDECSFVSLRDVERTMRVMMWFHELIPRLQIEPAGMSSVTYSFILALSVCYRAKLRDRTAFDKCLIANLASPLSEITEVSIISKEIDRCQTRVVELMKIPDHIARNAALKENLFMMYVCIQLKIPLFIIGKPGSSKSLARSIINHSINDGIMVGGNKIAEYTHVFMQCYQCSQYTTSKEIADLFDKCQTIQKAAAADYVACVVLDEVGLAEDSHNLPLKVLHSLLEDSATSEFAQRGPNVAFIGLSNWALDPAKMNRGIMVQLEDPTIEELVNTAHAIIKPSGQVDDVISERLNVYVRSLAEAYLTLLRKQNKFLAQDYFGLRDFYSLMKMLYSLCRQYDTALSRRIVIHAVKRNFGGITKFEVRTVFDKFLNDLDDSVTGPLSDPLSLISTSLAPPIHAETTGGDSAFDRSRYLLLLTENYVALDILFQSDILNKDTKVIFGSSFPLDKESFNICHNINRIKIHMELGEVVVLTNLSNLYESLYELLNQFYVRLLGKYWVTIGIGSQRVECPVGPNFRLIVIADKTTVYKQFPPPLINRLEKHILTNSTILSGDPIVKVIVFKLSLWIDSYVSVIESTHKYERSECFIGIQEDTPSFVIYSSISKLGFRGIEGENENVILEASKLELLKLASPDSILRLPRSKLSSEADSISDLYFSYKLFCLSDYLQHLFYKQTHSGDSPNIQISPFFSFVTTLSQLLTETDISEIIRVLEANCKVHYNISNLYLSQFKTEKEFVSCILEEISSIPPHKENRKIILIQCADGNANSDLISCAKYKVMEIVSEHKAKLNSNFYFLFIVRLLLVEQNCNFAGFCGIPWDSVHIDELRPPCHNLLPPLNSLKQTSVADIFNYKFRIQETPSITQVEDLNLFKRQRLLGCVQAAASRLTDPSQPNNQRNARRIQLLVQLLSDKTNIDVADILCDKISQLLSQISLPENSNAWSLLSSLRADNQTVFPTVMKTLSRYIDSAIEPILAGLLGVIDIHNNLELATSPCSEIRQLWKILFKEDSLFDFRFLISPEILLYSKSFNMEYSNNIPIFTSSFPFFLHVYQQVYRLYKELNQYIGKYDNWNRFEEIFDETSVGKAVKSIDVKNKSNPFCLHYTYLENFVRLLISQNEDQLYKVSYVLLVVAASNYRRDLKEIRSELDPEAVPEVTIPLIHIANEVIEERIAFVKEAFSLGFSLSLERSTLLDKAMRYPIVCYRLRNIDFELFKSIIQKCSEKVSIFLENTSINAMEAIDFVYKCQYLVEENLSLFYKDFSKELNPLRRSWYATQTVMLFATNIIESTQLRGSSNVQDMKRRILNKLQKVVSHEANLQSLQTFEGILDILVDMDRQLRKRNEDNIELTSVVVKMEVDRKRTIDLFQTQMTLFFQQFFTRIVFAEFTGIPEDLLSTLIAFSLNTQVKQDASTPSSSRLFQKSDLYTPELRSIILELLFREGLGRIWKQLEPQMSDIYPRVALTKSTEYDLTVIIVLHSLENTHHQRLAEHLTADEKLHYIYNLLQVDSLYTPFRHKSNIVSHSLLESVAVLRFCITWLVKWYSAVEFKTSYMHSVTTVQVKKNPSNTGLYNCLHLIDKNIESYSLDYTVLLFFLKTLYFRTGFGDVLAHSRYRNYKSKIIPEKQENMSSYLDIFYGFDPKYEEMLESLGNNERSTNNLKNKIKRKTFDQSLLFAIFSKSFTHYMTADNSKKQDTKRSSNTRPLSKSAPDSTVALQKRNHLLPSELQTLADGISQNKFLNMSQFDISHYTHQNTVLIAGLLCHIAVLLHHAKDNKFLKPLTLIHYDPLALRGKYLPAVPHHKPSVPRQSPAKKYSESVQLTREAFGSTFRTSSLINVPQVDAIHILGHPLERTGAPTGIRRLSALSVALLRALMHSIFTYTLQTSHMLHPTRITPLVELTGNHTCSEYFFLHLIQDITDLTTISNKTFEEAVLIIHTLIDQLIDKPEGGPTSLTTEDDLEVWEHKFENSYVLRHSALNDQSLRDMMRNVLTKSEHSDITLLRSFYEEEERDLTSRLWRHRNIIGYEHLLQVFSCQFVSTKYPLLDKFINEQPLLSVTKYIPEFVSLQVKLVQKSVSYYKDKKVKDLYIADFLEFIQREDSCDYQEYLREFTSLRIACFQLIKERHRLDACYPHVPSIYYDVTNTNTLVSQLVSTSQQSVGVLTSTIQLLVKIHNSFIDKYIETFPKKQSRSKSTIPLSLVTSHHLINYQAHLENLIFSNASHSYQIGEGTLITYDFKGIDNDFVNRFMLNKLSIQNDLKTEHSEGKLLTHLKRLQFNIPQEKLSEDSWSCIKAELMNPHDITEVLTLLELVINFASFGKERPQRPIKSYMHEVLKYPSSKGLVSNKADDACSLKHLLSLWNSLSVHRAKLGFHQLTHVPSCYTTGLDTTQIGALMHGIKNRTINDVLAILYDFILFCLSGQQDQATPLPNEKLQDSLLNFSNSNLFLTQANPIDYKQIPGNILVAHTVSTWTQLILHSKALHV